MNKKVIILRGVSGCGKSTLAQYISDLYNLTYEDRVDVQNSVICTADDYFMKDGEYVFDVTKLGRCHEYCQDKFENALRAEVGLVICANTNTKERDFKFYVDKAAEYGYDVFSLIVENRHGNKDSHNVPEETLKKQEEGIKNSLKLR
jgi:gluconate kinase